MKNLTNKDKVEQQKPDNQFEDEKKTPQKK